ncbi:MAG TPA: hypothetical protein VFM82_10505 [Flavobacteriaceae bacterium]|nr:hypothetical protein [Flavobacteriaceae bacterium]
MKKFLVLFVLFALPIVAYLFFASGVHNFGKLPVLNEKIAFLSAFSSVEGNPVKLKDKITILVFFGGQVEKMHGQAFNLNWVIYKDYHEFHDFQFVVLIKNGAQEKVQELTKEMAKTTNMSEWNFLFGSEEEIQNVFKSLKTNLKLNENFATNRVFIIDKNMALRGRNDDEGELLFGYDSSSVAELKDKMVDDVKVILAEYRLKLKKYDRE